MFPKFLHEQTRQTFRIVFCHISENFKNIFCLQKKLSHRYKFTYIFCYRFREFRLIYDLKIYKILIFYVFVFKEVGKFVIPQFRHVGLRPLYHPLFFASRSPIPHTLAFSWRSRMLPTPLLLQQVSGCVRLVSSALPSFFTYLTFNTRNRPA